MGEDFSIRVRVSQLLTRDDEMLMVEHAKCGHRYWLLPGGGVEPGETMLEAAAREVREETGYETEVGRLLLVCEAIHAPDRHLIDMVFAGTVTGASAVGDGHGDGDDRLRGRAWRRRDDIAALEMYPHIGAELVECWNEDFAGPLRYLGNVWRAHVQE